MPVCSAAVVSRSQRVTDRSTETTAVLYLSFVLLAVKNSFETSAGSWGSVERWSGLLPGSICVQRGSCGGDRK